VSAILELVPPLEPEQSPVLRFTVTGKPQPAGSKTNMPVRTHYPLTVYNVKQLLAMVRLTDANPKAKPWKKTIAQVALYEMGGNERFAGALGVRIEFAVERGVSVTRHWPIVKPDALKLARAVEDALTGVVWVDDAQIVKEYLSKRYCEPGEQPNVTVTVWQLR
jgi:Holliday junction resolvase RusA-like endonuclease